MGFDVILSSIRNDVKFCLPRICGIIFYMPRLTIAIVDE